MKTILVGIDGSEASHRAINSASELGAKFNATLILVYVLQSSDLIPPAEHQEKMKEVMGKQREMLRAIASAVLEDAADRAAQYGVPKIEHELHEGDAAQTILDAAEARKADMLVLGSRGLNPLQGVLIGSVSQKVLTLAKCPCLIVK